MVSRLLIVTDTSRRWKWSDEKVADEAVVVPSGLNAVK